MARICKAANYRNSLDVAQEAAAVRKLARRHEARLGGQEVGRGIVRKLHVVLSVGLLQAGLPGLQLLLPGFKAGRELSLQLVHLSLQRDKCQVGANARGGAALHPLALLLGLLPYNEGPVIGFLAEVRSLIADVLGWGVLTLLIVMAAYVVRGRWDRSRPKAAAPATFISRVGTGARTV